ncbi:glycoside hydrolase [Lysobacter sp. S4-A87]|uniref:sialidase family protein n=1 Tax=Lysobacter sp. S4-A87 TaxID=2925843 RepID=UPI001F534E12|nr:sialidase family protein [Lysobacter sp. S4-A87]UNK48351.1 glycoside hydrolase [Lysobacter sp. S4-A87]
MKPALPKPALILPLMLLLPVACDRTAPTATTADASSTAAAQPTVQPATTAIAQPWPLPSGQGLAAQPDLVRAPDGSLVLAWIETDGDAHALKFARQTKGTWSDVHEIARGDDWFVNWADTPHVAATADGALWAHWLKKSAKAPYAYDVALVRSGDDGRSWSQPMLVNDDGTPTEHGFVSLWPAARDRIGIAWLDGRNSGGGHEGGHEGHGGGAMTLRAALFDASLQRADEREIDTMTCDCCQTDAALGDRGPLLVYRDRTPEEIRDIAITRLQDGAWTPPYPVHADGWKMPACPVNGPAVTARGSDALVAWYTAAGGTPALKLARSSDAGDRFAAPLTVDEGMPVQGRVDLALDANAAWVLWMREDAGVQSLHLARYAPDLGRELQRVEVARLQGRGRATGFAQLALADDGAYVVWTDVVDGKPRLQGQHYRVAP